MRLYGQVVVDAVAVVVDAVVLVDAVREVFFKALVWCGSDEDWWQKISKA